MIGSSLSLRAARLVSGSIALLAVLAVVLLALPARNTVHHVRNLALAAPVTPAATPSPTPTATVTLAPPVLPTAPAVALPSATPATSAAPSASPPATTSTPPPPSSAAPSPTPSPSGGESSAVTASCPVGLKVPATTGGLQSLIGAAGAFGPFSAEAFAAAPAYAPLLTLLGPILAQYPALAAKFAAFTNPTIAVLAAVTTAGFDVLSPLYGPYREKVLEAEAQLANAFAPYVKQLVNSPVGGCAIAIESLLVGTTS